MKFGTFYEHQLPRPWADGDEAQLFTDALEQVELADRLGYHYVWDQIIGVQQAGRTSHAHICEALELFASEVMQEFAQRDGARTAAKAERLAGAVDAAMARKADTELARGALAAPPEGYHVDAYGLEDRARLLLLEKAGALGRP